MNDSKLFTLKNTFDKVLEIMILGFVRTAKDRLLTCRDEN